MSNDRSGEGLGTYTQWAEAFSKRDLDRALSDQAIIARSQMNEGNDHCRSTPSQPSKRAYDKIRTERDDLDYREWNSDTGFSGVNRWPKAPGIGRGAETERQREHRARKEILDDGF
jgi:hypothetical protein